MEQLVLFICSLIIYKTDNIIWLTAETDNQKILLTSAGVSTIMKIERALPIDGWLPN